MSVCPASRRGRRALPLLLFCLLATAGCAARGRSPAVPTATLSVILTATPTLAIVAVPTFTPTPTATPAPADSYRLQRRGNLVEATFMTTGSPVPPAARQPPQVLFTLDPEFRPPFPIVRGGMGQPVQADGSPHPAQPEPRPFRLQLDPDGAVRYLPHPDLADVDFLAYSLRLSWGTTPGGQ